MALQSLKKYGKAIGTGLRKWIWHAGHIFIKYKPKTQAALRKNNID